jgi:putative membrane protein
MSALAAFVHHLCFVAIMVVLSLEMLLLKQPLTADSARKLLRYDSIYGIGAGLVLVVGALRVIYLEKGPAYYMHSAPFIVKMGCFLIVGLISIYPTLTFVKWNRAFKQGGTPEWSDALARKLRIVVHVELSLLALMILCAAMMAKGMGYIGA